MYVEMMKKLSKNFRDLRTCIINVLGSMNLQLITSGVVSNCVDNGLQVYSQLWSVA